MTSLFTLLLRVGLLRLSFYQHKGHAIDGIGWLLDTAARPLFHCALLSPLLLMIVICSSRGSYYVLLYSERSGQDKKGTTSNWIGSRNISEDECAARWWLTVCLSPLLLCYTNENDAARLVFASPSIWRSNDGRDTVDRLLDIMQH